MPLPPGDGGPLSGDDDAVAALREGAEARAGAERRSGQLTAEERLGLLQEWDRAVRRVVR